MTNKRPLRELTTKGLQMIDDKLPEPPTPPDCDLRSFRYMPFDVARFRDSKFSATVDPASGFFAIQLWAAAWHQIPAGSLPDDDASLRMLSGCGRDQRLWESVRDGALYGFYRCADGRLYNTAIAEFALEAFSKSRVRINSENGRKGGRPKSTQAETENKPNENQTLTETKPKANQIETESKPNEKQELTENKAEGKGSEGNRSEEKRIEKKGIENTNTRASENPATETSAPLATPAGVSAEKTPLADLKKAVKPKPKPLTLLPADFGISEQVAAWAIKNGHTMLDDRLEHFKNWASAGAKQYADWDAAFRNAIAGDWAHINDRKPAPITGRPQAFKPSTRQSAVAAADDAYELIFKEKRPDTDDDKQIIQGVLA